MKLTHFATLAYVGLAAPVLGADVTYRNDVKPFLNVSCGECHGDSSPALAEFKLDSESYKKEKQGPRFNTYESLLQIIAYPDSGAFMRRLDDGTMSADRKPGNMHKHLGETESERAANLTMLKAWVGAGAWNLNRWKTESGVPGISKEQMNKLQLTY